MVSKKGLFELKKCTVSGLQRQFDKWHLFSAPFLGGRGLGLGSGGWFSRGKGGRGWGGWGVLWGQARNRQVNACLSKLPFGNLP